MLLPRSVSFRRFSVSGRRVDPTDPAFIEALQRHQFQPLAAEAAEQESAGWVSFSNFLDTDLLLSDVYDQGYVRLGLRIDKRVVAPGLVRAHVELEAKALREATGAKPGRRELDDIRQGVVEMLRPQTQPRTQFIRAVWNAKRKVLYLTQLSEPIAERFGHVFAETFDGRKLSSLEPLTLVRHLSVSRDLISQIEVIDPADFRPTAHRKRVVRQV